MGRGTVHKWLWFVGLWVASIAVLGAIAILIRAVIL